jgi:hypothetical protein
VVVLWILTAFARACGDSFLLSEVRACCHGRCDANSATLLQPWLTILVDQMGKGMDYFNRGHWLTGIQSD